MFEGNEDLRWYHLAICSGMPTNWFYDDYETDQTFAALMDDICLACPVRSQCLRDGVENNEFGLWGGVYLSNGRMDGAKNAHKDESIWDMIRSGIDG